LIHRDRILDYCWLINLRGARDSFQAVDENMEHNIRDSKASLQHSIMKTIVLTLFIPVQGLGKHGGPSLLWQILSRWTPTLPVFRAVRDLVEAEVNAYKRGKSHTAPNHAIDVKTYSEKLLQDRVFTTVAGRTLSKESTPIDLVRKGAVILQTGTYMQDWREKRDLDHETAENYSQDLCPDGTGED
jgi:hypothetical protein